jgi:regulatory protein
MRDSKHNGQQGRRLPKPLNSTSLHELALSYVARFATSGAKLERYLRRKLHERGWEGEQQADTAALTAQFVELGYVDDAVYARAKSSSLLGRGYGGRRVNQALGEAGIAAEIREEVAPGERAARAAALRLAQRRKFGPFGNDLPERERREKQLSAMLRAGHSLDNARNLVNAASEEQALAWAGDCDEDDDEPLF